MECRVLCAASCRTEAPAKPTMKTTKDQKQRSDRAGYLAPHTFGPNCSCVHRHSLDCCSLAA